MAHHVVTTMAPTGIKANGSKAKVEVFWDQDKEPDFSVECENNFIARAVALVAGENFRDAERVAYCMNEFYREGRKFPLDDM